MNLLYEIANKYLREDLLFPNGVLIIPPWLYLWLCSKALDWKEEPQSTKHDNLPLENLLSLKSINNLKDFKPAISWEDSELLILQEM